MNFSFKSILMICGFLLCMVAQAFSETKIPVQNKIDDDEYGRIEFAIIRAERALARSKVAALRIQSELNKISSLSDISAIDEQPSKVIIDKPVVHDLYNVANYMHDILERVQSKRKFCQKLMKNHLLPKPEPIAIPEWKHVIEGLKLDKPTSSTDKRYLLEYIETAAFLSEQAAQVCEILEEQAIALAEKEGEKKIDKAQNSSNNYWRFLGPESIPEGEGYNGKRVPVSGRVSAVVLDPFNPDNLFAGTALGGIWLSRNRGSTWNPLSDYQLSLAIGALAADKNSPGGIFAGTGEGNIALRKLIVDGDRKLVGHRGKGLLKSNDWGKTWKLTGLREFGGGAFLQLSTSANAPGYLLAATTKGLFLSKNKGESWKRMYEGLPVDQPYSIATSAIIDPNNSSIAYAAFWGTGVYRTKDLHKSKPVWYRLLKGLPASNVTRIQLAISASGKTIYALVANADSRLRGLYVSFNEGKRWSIIKETPDLLQGQGFFNMMLGIHPKDDKTILVGGVGNRTTHSSSLYRGVEIEGNWYFTPIGGELHVDFHDIAFDPRKTERFYVANDGGIWRTEDGGRSWIACNNGLSITQVISIDEHIGRMDFLIAGTQDNGTIIYDGSSEWRHVDDGDGGLVKIHPKFPNLVFNEFITYRLARSNDKGKRGTFTPIHPILKNEVSAFVAPYDVNPSSHNEIALGAEKLYFTQNGGQTWKTVNHDFTRGQHGNRLSVISALRFVGENKLVIGTSDGAIWRLQRNENDWDVQQVFNVGIENHKPIFVSAIFGDADDPYTLFIGLDTVEISGFWRCSETTKGRFECVSTSIQTKTSLNEGPIYAIEKSSVDKKALYIGTVDGVYVSIDNGDNWHRLGKGLPHVPVFDLSIQNNLKLLRAATFGRGVWEIDL